MECDIYLYGLLLILIASGKGSHILLLRNWQCLFEKLKKFVKQSHDDITETIIYFKGPSTKLSSQPLTRTKKEEK